MLCTRESRARHIINAHALSLCAHQKSFVCLMFRRTLLGVSDPFPSFPSTPPRTQLSLLLTGMSAITFADPRGGSLFGRVAEKSPLTEKQSQTGRARPRRDILLISSSLTATMLDDFSTATTAHGLQLHTMKTKIISNTRSENKTSNSVEVQGININILPEGQIKYIGQLITVKDAIRVDPDHRIKCAWVTFTDRS